MPAPDSATVPPQRSAPPPPGLSFHTGRIHLAARQRGADATAVGEILLQLPQFTGSLIVVALLSQALPTMLGYLMIGLWLTSGALVFHRPTERFLARYLFHVRLPLRAERDRLEPIWQEVTTRAGIDGSGYELWIEESGGLNAFAAAGHIVAVTRYSLNELPPVQLAAVLAHELGHHKGGHAWAGLLGYWYSLPGRVTWQLLRRVTAVLLQVVAAFSVLGVLVIALLCSAVLITVATSFPPVLLVFVTPYLVAAVGRRAELRADRLAAELGFAPAMLDVLHAFRRAEEASAERAHRSSNGKRATRPRLADRLLASHPDSYTRIRQLEDYLAVAA
ncbi:M48 family metalloprotease [Kitasatospora sp. MAP12-22]|uniref:M48 family metalloprotease n=1 Tax=Kitasatospora sp. MAP12-22 TaxID=3156301 RepID=UPI0035183B5D